MYLFSGIIAGRMGFNNSVDAKNSPGTSSMTTAASPSDSQQEKSASPWVLRVCSTSKGTRSRNRNSYVDHARQACCSTRPESTQSCERLVRTFRCLHLTRSSHRCFLLGKKFWRLRKNGMLTRRGALRVVVNVRSFRVSQNCKWRTARADGSSTWTDNS